MTDKLIRVLGSLRRRSKWCLSVEMPEKRSLQVQDAFLLINGEDDSFQARLLQAAATQSQSHQAADLDANQISIDGSVQKHSREAQKVNITTAMETIYSSKRTKIKPN